MCSLRAAQCREKQKVQFEIQKSKPTIVDGKMGGVALIKLFLYLPNRAITAGKGLS